MVIYSIGNHIWNHPVKRSYFKNILVGLDQFVGTIFGIDADETISSYIGRNYPNTWKEKIINWLFSNPNHCRDNIEWDEIK